MPLTRRQFELGVDEEDEALMRQVYELLAGHPELAYSHQELETAVLGEPAALTELGKFRRAVKVLVGIGAVDQREVAQTDYYGFLREFDTATWMSLKVPL